jgi:excisionase family DNA binding protein
MTRTNSAAPSDYLTKQELADMLRVTTRTITNYVHGGALPAPTKVGRKALWNRTQLQGFLAQQAAQASA